MGEYSRNGTACNTESVGCMKTNQALWVECFRIVDTVFTKVIHVQRLHMDLMLDFVAFSGTGNRKEFAEKQRKECANLEEEIRSLKKTMLERVLSSETDSPNVITLPRVSNETVSALPNIESSTLKHDPLDEIKQENDIEMTDETEENVDFAVDVKPRNGWNSGQSFALAAENEEGDAEENRMNHDHNASAEKFLVILPMFPNLLHTQENTALLSDKTEIPESFYKTEVYAGSSNSTNSNGQISARKKNSAQHLRSHENDQQHTYHGKSYECGVCARKLASKESLVRHLRIHNDEKPYECKVCERKFRDDSTLGRHLRIHSSEKPYECKVCAKKFRGRSQLVRHLKIDHGEQPYECDVCVRKFFYRSELVCHLRIHDEEKRYECDVCARKFASKNSLVRHLRIHNDEMPYECNVCGRKFRVASTLTRHLKIHTARSHTDGMFTQESFVNDHS